MPQKNKVNSQCSCAEVY